MSCFWCKPGSDRDCVRSVERSLLQLVLLVSALALFSETFAAPGDYLQGRGPCDFRYPRDHGAHPGYRTEWWYYTGNVETESRRRFGFQVTFFRLQISPPDAQSRWPKKPSRWRTNQLYFAHAALSDPEKEEFHVEEKVARGVVGLAGEEQEKDVVHLFVGDWSIRIGPQSHTLEVSSSEVTLDLRGEPQKGPVCHGDGGYSRKGVKAESASCYYSFPRLRVSGIIRTEGMAHEVTGSAWMDHEYSSAPLEKNLTGWDWFSIQLTNQTEVMLYLLRRKEGGHSRASSGTFVGPSGHAHHLYGQDFTVKVLEQWKSPRTRAVYPSRWEIRIPSLGLVLNVSPNMADQELVTEKSTGVTYWEGSVSIRGTRDTNPIKGQGYVELTGYAGSFDIPM